jgi:hypothetical protein
MPRDQDEGEFDLGTLANEDDLSIYLFGVVGSASEADVFSGFVEGVLEFELLYYSE